MRDMEKDLAICAAASPAPWTVDEGNGEFIYDVCGDGEFRHIDGWTDTGEDWMCLSPADAAFIATAREALPYYIGRVQELEAEVKRLSDTKINSNHRDQGGYVHDGGLSRGTWISKGWDPIT